MESSVRGGMQLRGLAVILGISDATVVSFVLIYRSKGYFNAAARVQLLILSEKARRGRRPVGFAGSYEGPRARGPERSLQFPFAWTAGGQQIRLEGPCP